MEWSGSRSAAAKNNHERTMQTTATRVGQLRERIEGRRGEGWNGEGRKREGRGEGRKRQEKSIPPCTKWIIFKPWTRERRKKELFFGPGAKKKPYHM